MPTIDFSKLPDKKTKNLSNLPDRTDEAIRGNIESLSNQLNDFSGKKNTGYFQGIVDKWNAPRRERLPEPEFVTRFKEGAAGSFKEAVSDQMEVSRRGLEGDVGGVKTFLSTLGNILQGTVLVPVRGIEEATAPLIEPIVDTAISVSRSASEKLIGTKTGEAIGEFGVENIIKPLQEMISKEQQEKVAEGVKQLIKLSKDPSNRDLAQGIGNIVETGLMFLGGKAIKEPLKKGVDLAQDTAGAVSTGVKDLGQEIVSSAKQGVSVGESLAKDSKVIAKQRALEQKADIAGEITRAKLDQKPSVGRALEDMDGGAIKTYKEFKDKAHEQVVAFSEKLGSILDKNKVPIKKEKLVVTNMVKGKELKTNYVEKAITQLKELFAKTENPVELEKITALEAKMGNVGLTRREVNELAILHGLNRSGFNLSGTPSTSVVKQGYENVRKGLKETYRQYLPDDTAKALDLKISDAITTRELVGELAETVNTLTQDLMKEGIGQKIAGGMAKFFNRVTGRFIPQLFFDLTGARNQGFKKMNSLRRQKELPGLLEKFKNISDLPTIKDRLKAFSKMFDFEQSTPLNKALLKLEEFLPALPAPKNNVIVPPPPRAFLRKGIEETTGVPMMLDATFPDALTKPTPGTRMSFDDVLRQRGKGRMTDKDIFSSLTEAENTALGEILVEFKWSEAGSRIFTESSVGSNLDVTSIPSSFPQWVPADLRRKKYIDEAIEILLGERKLKTKKQKEMMDIIYEEMQKRAPGESLQTHPKEEPLPF